MEWKRIPKEITSIPNHGSKYSDWKSEIAEEGFHQCVYCAISENAFGGIRNFHIEHYRPKSKRKDLENEFSNLFYACSICNSFKGNDWPNEPNKEMNNIAYPNPSVVNYNDIFEVNNNLHIVNGKNISATYIVERLYLNRPQLILERKQSLIIYRIKKLNEIIHSQKEELYNNINQNQELTITYLKQLDAKINKIQDLLISVNDIIPYSLEQTKR